MRRSILNLALTVFVGLSFSPQLWAASVSAIANVSSTVGAVGGDAPISLSAVEYGPPQGVYGGVSRAFAEADLRSGTLRGSGLSVNQDGAQSIADLRDKITFTANPGTPANTPFNVSLHFHFDGLFDLLPTYTGELLDGIKGRGAQTRISLLMYDLANPSDTAGASIRHTITKLVRYTVPGTTTGVVVADTVDTLPTVDSHTTLNLIENSDTTLVGDMFVDLSVLSGAQWNINAELVTNTYSDLGLVAFSDFGHTGTLGVTLPAGYGFTSESGVLLSAVPLPGAFWLFATATVAGTLLTRLSRNRS